MKKLKCLVIIATVCLSSSCGSNSNKNEKGHPAHEDSTGKSIFNMLFAFIPATPAQGHATQFTLRPVKATTDSTVALEIQHEKKIHLIVVAEDLSSFKHLHPAEQTDGSYTLTDTFPHGGNYNLYADYKPAGAEKEVTMHTIKVTGNEPTPSVYATQKLYSKTSGYTVTLKPGDPVISSGKEIMLMAEISDANGILTPAALENYLGEKAHMVIIGVFNKKYLHVHPMVMGNELMLHSTFPEAGIYRAWLEFKKDGKVNVADFVIKAD